MKVKIENYDHLIVDIFGTLFNEEYEELKGAYKFIEKNLEKVTLVSNIGSIKGEDLKKKLNLIGKLAPIKVITSLDLAIKYLESNYSSSQIMHFGGKKAEHELSKLFNIQNCYSKSSDVLIMTSLPSENFIKDTQQAMRFFLETDKEILLANPDRITPEPPFKIRVAMIFDMLRQQSKRLRKNIKFKEIGKPNLKRSDLKIKNRDKVLVIGDNPDTDISLANSLQCESVLVTSKDNIKNKNYIDQIWRLV